MSKKDAFNPSAIATFLICQFKYYVIHELGLDAPQEKEHYLYFGSLFHAVAAAQDAGWDWREELRKEVKKMKVSKLYLAYDMTGKPIDSDKIDALAREMEVCLFGGEYEAADGKVYAPIQEAHKGGYQEFAAKLKRTKRWKWEAIEKRYYVDVGPAILAPMPDGVVREKGKLYIIERKTSTSSSLGWYTKWKTNLQTTAEAVAVSKYYDEPVEGVYLIAMKYSRKKMKFWEPKTPQPLHRIEYEEPRPIEKGAQVYSQFEMFMEDFAAEIKDKRNTGRWLQNGNSCSGCSLWSVCWGNMNLDDLVESRGTSGDKLEDAPFQKV